MAISSLSKLLINTQSLQAHEHLPRPNLGHINHASLTHRLSWSLFNASTTSCGSCPSWEETLSQNWIYWYKSSWILSNILYILSLYFLYNYYSAKYKKSQIYRTWPANLTILNNVNKYFYLAQYLSNLYQKPYKYYMIHNLYQHILQYYIFGPYYTENLG